MLNNDPWKHRSKGMRCATCMWFVLKEQSEPDTTETRPSTKENLGRCRRHAPTSNGFVPVYGVDWCGDHRLDENKI